MKKWTALRLHRLATWIYSDEHVEHVEIEDEYGICRYSADITGDEYAHGTGNIFAQLPEDWTFHQWVDGQQWR